MTGSKPFSIRKFLLVFTLVWATTHFGVVNRSRPFPKVAAAQQPLGFTASAPLGLENKHQGVVEFRPPKAGTAGKMPAALWPTNSRPHRK